MTRFAKTDLHSDIQAIPISANTGARGLESGV